MAETLLRDTAAQDRPIEPRSFIVRHRLGLALGSLFMIGVLFLAWRSAQWSGAGASVSRERLAIATVERGGFVRDVAADGQVVAAGSPTLYANAAGTVTLQVHAGDAVDKGQVLAIIASPDLTARLSQEDATLQGLRIDWQRARLEADRKLEQLRDAFEQAQVDQKTAQRELERSRKAFELGAYSELQVSRAEDSLEKAHFAFAQAKMNVDSQPAQNRFDVDSRKALLDRQGYLVDDLKRQVAGLELRSPVVGQIGQVQIADRANVAKDAPLLTVIDLSALEVEIKVPESFARDLRVGMVADLDGDGRHWKGWVGGVSPEVVAGQVTTRVRFGEDKPAGLRQNQRMSVRIFIDRRDDVLMVDRGSFVDQEGGGFAYVVHDHVAERRPVSLGAASVDKIEVREGLKEGDRVVIDGTATFKGAARIILTN